MNISPAERFDPPFVLDLPDSGPAAVVFNSPHSGSVYAQALLDASRLDRLGLRRSEDVDVDVLFDGVMKIGGSLMRVKFPRAYDGSILPIPGELLLQVPPEVPLVSVIVASVHTEVAPNIAVGATVTVTFTVAMPQVVAPTAVL